MADKPHFLLDGKWWTNSDGSRISLKDMDGVTARHIYNLLVARADHLGTDYSLWLVNNRDSVEEPVVEWLGMMVDDLHGWLLNTPVMQALTRRIEACELPTSCWCGHSDADHITPADDPRPQCVGCSARPVGHGIIPEQTFHSIASLRPPNDHLKANHQGLPYDDKYRARRTEERRRHLAKIREDIATSTGLASNLTIDRPLPEFEPPEPQQGDEHLVFIVTTGYYSDFSIESAWVGDRVGAHRHAHLLGLKGERSVEIQEESNRSAGPVAVQLSEDPEILVVRYRTAVTSDSAQIRDMDCDLKIDRLSAVPKVTTDVRSREDRYGVRVGIEVATLGPIDQLERIRKVHSERLAEVRSAIVEHNPIPLINRD